MKRVIAIVNGALTGEKEFYQNYIQAEDKVVCADGGANYAHELGLTPDLIIGDLDSITQEIKQKYQTLGVEFKKFTVEKDKTDTQLLLEELIIKGYKKIIVLAAVGNRLDHTLANLYLLEKLSTPTVEIKFVTSQQTTELITNQKIITDQIGATVSLLPLTKQVQGVTLKGFKYPLTETTLTRGSSLTISNTIQAKNAKISLKQGKVLVIINH
ncbi:thiamine diphosphokinase [Halanaerobaculum tunisiense]